MYSRCPRAFLALVALFAASATVVAAGAPRAPLRELRVCAHPHNLPYSNRRLAGFENKIAALLGRELQVTVHYAWWESPRGFLRNTLNADRCDVVIGVPSGLDATLNTAPYYRSSYVFVSRRDRRPRIDSFDDPALRAARIGVQLLGDESAPPVQALANHGIVGNVVGFPVINGGSDNNSAARLVAAVASGQVDLAIVWGPAAGFFARQAPVGLTLAAARPPLDHGLPFVFDIAMGVRKGNDTLRQALQRILQRRRQEIDNILEAYAVPRLELPG